MRTVSSYPADKSISLCFVGAPASSLATKRVPTHTPDAPYLSGVQRKNNAILEMTNDRDAARPRPSAIPPAATTMTGCPVSGLIAFLHKSTHAGPSLPCSELLHPQRVAEGPKASAPAPPRESLGLTEDEERELAELMDDD